jgi:hypothetical protein
MTGSRVVIVNGTDDDAVCKVSGGGGVPSRTPAKAKMWKLPRKRTSRPMIPTPCTLHFSIEIGDEEVTPAVRSLKLVKDSQGYRIEVTNGNGSKPK